MEKYESIDNYSFYGPHIFEKEFLKQSKIIGIKRFKLITTADLRKRGLKMRECPFKELCSS